MRIAAMLTTYEVLSYSSLAVTNDAFHYSGHIHVYINGNGHKFKLKSSNSYLTNHTKSK